MDAPTPCECGCHRIRACAYPIQLDAGCDIKDLNDLSFFEVE